MAKIKCPNCHSVIESNAETPRLTCPTCGKNYKNPFYKPLPPEPAPRIVTIPAEPIIQRITKKGDSEFKGGLGSLIGLRIVNFLILLFTLTIAAPVVICRSYRWKLEHEVLDGYKLIFDGRAGQLFGQWFKWVFLSIITIGIYSFWVPIKKQQWITSHTHIQFDDEVSSDAEDAEEQEETKKSKKNKKNKKNK